MDWLITLPKTVAWENYARELAAVENSEQVLNYRVRYQPKGMTPGDRVFVTHDGQVRGWMTVTDVRHKPNGFRCTTTGTAWPAGWYVQRAGRFNYVGAQPYPGFRGIRHFTYKP